MERCSCGIIPILSHNLPGRTGKANLSLDSQCPDQDSNQAPPKYECTALLLDQSVQFSVFCTALWQLFLSPSFLVLLPVLRLIMSYSTPIDNIHQKVVTVITYKRNCFHHQSLKPERSHTLLPGMCVTFHKSHPQLQTFL